MKKSKSIFFLQEVELRKHLFYLIFFSGFGSIGIGIGSEGQSKGSEKNVGPGGEKDQIVRAETVKTKELNKRMSNLFEDFDDEEPKPKANDKAEPEDDDIDGDDLLDMMDNL